MNAAATNEPLDRLKRLSLIGAVAGLVICAVGAIVNLDRFLQSYLTAYLFWWSLSIGCLGLLMLNHLVGGAWGYATRPVLAAAVWTLPLLAVLFVPIALCLDDIYVWARPDVVAEDSILQHKAGYLNSPFFLIRAIGFFVLWIGLGVAFSRKSIARQSLGPAPCLNAAVCGMGIVFTVLTVSFAAMDWAMSLQPYWYSTIYGALIMAGGVLGAMALVVCMAAGYGALSAIPEEKALDVLQDLGSLLLAFVMLWAYFAFSQYLIIWSANLPGEAVWYAHRLRDGWQWVALLLLMVHFVVPFLWLLSRERKRDAKAMSAIACVVLAIHYVELYWNVIPSFYERGFHLSWLDFVAPAAMGGLWLFVFTWQLQGRLADSSIEVSKA